MYATRQQIGRVVCAAQEIGRLKAHRSVQIAERSKPLRESRFPAACFAVWAPSPPAESMSPHVVRRFALGWLAFITLPTASRCSSARITAHARHP